MFIASNLSFMLNYTLDTKLKHTGGYDMKRHIIGVGLLLMILLLTACSSSKGYEGDFSYDIKEFEFTNQNGETVSKEDLEGDFWVADFIFTNCTSACPPMTNNMARLQTMVEEAGLEDQVRFVSFSIDPEHDSPEVLKEFANKFQADFTNWDFLTGYEPQTIKEFALKSFKAPVEKLPLKDAPEGQPDYDFMHSSRMYIITPEGKAIKGYIGTDINNMEPLFEDLKGYIN